MFHDIMLAYLFERNRTMIKRCLISLCLVLFTVSCVSTSEELSVEKKEPEIVTKNGYQMRELKSLEDAKPPEFVCFNTEALLSSIIEDGMNQVIIKGIDVNGNLVRIFRSVDSRWVLTFTMPAVEMTCPVGSGPYMETIYDVEGKGT